MERLENDGELVNACGGSENDPDHPDALVLMDFADYIYASLDWCCFFLYCFATSSDFL